MVTRDNLATFMLTKDAGGNSNRDTTPLGATFPFATSNALDVLWRSMDEPALDADDTIIAMAMVVTVNADQHMRQVIRSDSNGVWKITANAQFAGEVIGNQDLNAAGLGTQAEGPIKVFCTRFVAAQSRSKTYLTDLIYAEQAKKMRKENIKSYFAQYGIDKVTGTMVLKVVSSLALLIPPLREVATLDVADTPWMSYRKSASSTPALVQRAIDIWGTTVEGMFLPTSLTAVAEARAQPWNVNLARAIPPKMITMTHATLTAFSCYPDDWKYGNSHKLSCNAMLYKGYEKAARRLAVLGSNTEAMTNAMTLQELVKAIPSTLKGI